MIPLQFDASPRNLDFRSWKFLVNLNHACRFVVSDLPQIIASSKKVVFASNWFGFIDAYNEVTQQSLISNLNLR